MRTLLAVLVACLPASLVASTSWSLSSPDGRCSISVSLSREGSLGYQAFLEDRAVILPSPLGAVREDERFDRGLTLEKAEKPSPHREVYELFAGANPHVDHTLNRRTLVFRNPHNALLALDLAAGSEGVAFRTRFPEESPQVRVLLSELTGFSLPANATGWLQPYHAAGDYTPAYEDFYFKVSPNDSPPHSRGKPLGWSFPALFHVPDANAWLLLAESGTDASYCATHLRPDGSKGLFHIAFPAADETTKGHTNHFSPEPRSTLPWTTPWRVLVLGRSAGDIALSTLITDLAPPCRIKDTSWIKPGRASWAWWSYPDGPNTAARFDEFTDFAARMGWEYTLFDAGWWDPGLKPIAEHARKTGVVPIAWTFAGDFYSGRTRRRKLDQLQAAGVGGVKVDFWCSDRQETMTAMLASLEDAASRKLVVNFHGCTVPRGWQRTWPNLLTAEAVLGAECYFFEPAFTTNAARLNTILPFTRNAVAPMDYTPIALSPKKYPRTTTAAHELATSIVFTSGLIHYADRPEVFEALPSEAQRLLRDAPAHWEETRCLMGEPGRVAVFARRSGNSWFIAGINGTDEALPLNLDLSPYRGFRRRELIKEGSNPQMQVEAVVLQESDIFRHEMPARGGFILRLATL